MAKSLSLSDAAYRALEAERRANESLSDVVLRLHATAGQRRKEPLKFLEDVKKLKRSVPYDEHLRWIERSRAADRRKARDLETRWRS